jgi:RimJ/RimL family protein N-acetyltransferase
LRRTADVRRNSRFTPICLTRSLFIMDTPLQGSRISLRPLQYSDAEALVNAAADGELWNLTVTVVPSALTVDAYLKKALDGRDAGTVKPFVIVLMDSGEVIGSTRLWKIDRLNRKLEIGSSWISARWQKTFVNTEAKYLLLRYAFETLDCVRVQFTTDENNQASRNAILRLGAQQEGIVRHERIMPDGRKRNSVRFSIIDEEWPQVKQHLQAKLAERVKAADDQPSSAASIA